MDTHVERVATEVNDNRNTHKLAKNHQFACISRVKRLYFLNFSITSHYHLYLIFT